MIEPPPGIRVGLFSSYKQLLRFHLIWILYICPSMPQHLQKTDKIITDV